MLHDVPVPASQDPLRALEDKFDARMAQMETTIRSALMSSSRAAAPVVVAPPPVPVAAPQLAASPVVVPPPAVAPPPPAPLPSVSSDTSLPPAVGHSSRSSDVGHHSSHRHHSRTTRSPSSASRSSSSDSSSSRSRSRSWDHKRKHRKHGKYSTLKYLPEFRSVSSYERLVLANLRMLRRFYKKDRDIYGLLDHFILLAEKAEKDVFMDEALLSYDESVKQRAKDNGLKEFSQLNPSETVKHLSYDGTKAGSAKVSRKSARQSSNGQSHGGGSSAGCCLKYNFSSGGCHRSQCNYKHACSACGSTGHVNADCPNVDRSARGSKK